MKQLIPLTILYFLLTACSLGNSPEVFSPTPLLVVPTTVSPQDDAPLPTATKMTGITAVTTVTPSTIITTPPPNNHLEVQVANQGLSASTETQVAWVQDDSILMLDVEDGSQRELARAHEIVELLWFPDGRHLLYVDQQEPVEPDGPPWPNHALWLVDTDTAEQWQLGTLEEDLHRIGLSPAGLLIRSQPGSDFADACFMDRRLVFVELDENYQRVALYDSHDFDSVLSDRPYWFFPADLGEWVSDHEYEVNLTAFCLSTEAGASEEELALFGRYRLDLETGTAVKVGNR